MPPTTPVPAGPYATREEAGADVADIYEAIRRRPARHGPAASTECMERLTGACRAARVEVGAYDGEVLAWLARFEPETCQVIAGLIRRAYAGPAPDDDRAHESLLDLFEGGHIDQAWQAVLGASRADTQGEWRAHADELAEVLTRAATRARQYAYQLRGGGRWT